MVINRKHHCRLTDACGRGSGVLSIINMMLSVSLFIEAGSEKVNIMNMLCFTTETTFL